MRNRLSKPSYWYAKQHRDVFLVESHDDTVFGKRIAIVS